MGENNETLSLKPSAQDSLNLGFSGPCKPWPRPQALRFSQSPQQASFEVRNYLYEWIQIIHYNLSKQKQYLQQSRQGRRGGQAESLKAHKCSIITPIFTLSAHFTIHLWDSSQPNGLSHFVILLFWACGPNSSWSSHSSAISHTSFMLEKNGSLDTFYNQSCILNKLISDKYAFLSQYRNISTQSWHHIYTLKIETHRPNNTLDNIKEK